MALNSDSFASDSFASDSFASDSYVEVVINVPIRRTFRPLAAPDAPAEPADAGSQLQLFHYHLPAELQGRVQPGHLIWAPFGRQELQGVVVRGAATSPVPTKAILRLARPEPVLTPVQIELAQWIAEAYVAPLSEAVRLFLPPGLLEKEGQAAGVRARRELRIQLLTDRATAEARLLAAASPTARATVMAWLLQQPAASSTIAAVVENCQLASRSLVLTMARTGVLTRQGEEVMIAGDALAEQQHHGRARILERLLPIVDALAAAGGLLWQHELYAQAPADLDKLRQLAQAGIVALREEVRFRDPLAGRTYPPTTAPAFTSEQQAVWRKLEAIIAQPPASRRPVLIHGVTGSGKTEIYLRAITSTLAQGRQAVVMVPEIALTPQTVARFASRFPGRVTVIHSALSIGERYDVWRAIGDGLFDVVVGPRSALFAPLARLGLIVIDEEHENTYKQDAEEWGSFKVFYDARTVARQLAALTGSLLLLGSATPSLESYYAAEQGDVTLLSMPRRVMGHRDTMAGLEQAAVAGEVSPTIAAGPVYGELPPVEIVDMRQELRAGNRSIFSRSLASELQGTLAAGEQAILFLNRRGAHTFILCRDCGHVLECPRCAIPLTYHEQGKQLLCHRCNRRAPVPEVCPQCQGKRIKFFGAGTERIAAAVGEIAPQARVIRWDADTTGRRGSHEEILRTFTAHEADVLIGTQMIAKGLDLPMVTLVGVVAADVGLFLPDFRSSERTFQLLTQVAGRAGRSERGGRVVIQSYRPEHHAIQAAAHHDYVAFYLREIAFRREHGYPPLRRLAKLVYWDKKPEKAKAEGEQMAARLRRQLLEMGIGGQLVSVLGPAPAFFERVRGYYRWQVLLRAPDPALVLRAIDIPFGWRVDIDPTSIL